MIILTKRQTKNANDFNDNTHTYFMYLALD